MSKYYQKNKEKIREKWKLNYPNIREKHLAQNRKYYQEHIEKFHKYHQRKMLERYQPDPSDPSEYPEMLRSPNEHQRKRIWRMGEVPPKVSPFEFFKEDGDAIENAKKLMLSAYSLASKSTILLKKLKELKGTANHLECTRCPTGEITLRKVTNRPKLFKI